MLWGPDPPCGVVTLNVMDPILGHVGGGSFDPLQLAGLTLAATAYALRSRTLADEGRAVPAWRRRLLRRGSDRDRPRPGLASRPHGWRAAVGPHGPAPGDRRHRRRADRARADRAAAAAPAGDQGDRRPPCAHPSSRGAAPVGGEPLHLAHPGALPGDPDQRSRSRPPALLLHRLRDPDVDAGLRPAAEARLVRAGGEARLRGRGPLRGHGPRERLHVVEHGLLSRLRPQDRPTSVSTRSQTRARRAS